MDSRHGSQGRVATPPDHGRHYGARMAIHPDKRTDLEQRKRELGKEPDWGAYQAVERQVGHCLYILLHYRAAELYSLPAAGA